MILQLVPSNTGPRITYTNAVMISLTLLGAALAYLGWSMICMKKNARKARSMQVHIFRLPVDVANVFWLTENSSAGLLRDPRSLPIHWSSYPDFIRFSAQFRDKAKPSTLISDGTGLGTRHSSRHLSARLQLTDPDANYPPDF